MTTEESVVYSCRLQDLAKSLSGNYYAELSVAGIENLLALIKKQIEHLKDISARSPSLAASSLWKLSDMWCDLLLYSNRDERIRDITEELLVVAESIQKTSNTYTCCPLSPAFLAKLSSVIISEMVESTPQDECRFGCGSRIKLWMLDISAFEDMLLATMKASLTTEDPFRSLREMIDETSSTALLTSFAVDYYRTIQLLSTDNEQIKILSINIINFLLKGKS